MVEISTRGKLGPRIRKARIAAGLSFRVCAAEVGIAVATLQRIEAGTFLPQLGTLHALSDVLGVTFITTPKK